MDGAIGGAIMMTDIVNLSMAVMAAGYAVVGTGLHDLVEFHLTVGTTLIRET